MAQTYVFDFYNLYIPRKYDYRNKELGIRIKPLKFAEEFEKSRTSFSKPCYRGGWKTAKCYITTKNEEEAKKIAGWLEFLYSFAQSRSIFFLGWYKYDKGQKYSSFQSKFVEPRDNRFSELLHGVHTKGPFYTRDISLFIDTSLKTLNEAKEDELHKILTIIHSYNISRSEMVRELKFLICWIALEKLANEYHSKNDDLFTKDEIKNIKTELSLKLDQLLENDKRKNIIKDNIVGRRKNYLYDYNTYRKMINYLRSLDLGYDRKKLNKLIGKLIGIRVNLVHNLNSPRLKEKPQFLFYLQKIMEIVIFRLLGVDKDMQNKFLLRQYNRGDEL